MSDYNSLILESLSDSEYTNHFFNAVRKDFIDTGFLPALLESTDLIIQARKHKDPDLVREVYLLRGIVYFYQAEFDKAKENFQKATEYNKDDLEAKVMMELSDVYEAKSAEDIKLLLDYIGIASISPSVTTKPHRHLEDIRV
ncbi:MAG: tetratricopeptide repeat protein [Candidatus Poribacteria bacterium]|nr:tetratricopeptide repeat protein [Candidatus Poribacteria bacterium]MDE0502588.1 tetratricopeptide repeat protein [Candidatus Poribacteria bacterium]